jgi:hypothetical protein
MALAQIIVREEQKVGEQSALRDHFSNVGSSVESYHRVRLFGC